MLGRSGRQMTAERRQFVRLSIGGNAEITAVHGKGSVPTERAVLVDCSRSGALLRVPATKRRLLSTKVEPLQAQDSITCTLRLPPSYAEIEVFAEVVRVSWAGNNEFHNVGVRFFYDAGRRSHTDRAMGDLIQALGPQAWSQSSAIMIPLKDRTAAKPKPKTSARVERVSKRVKHASARLEKQGKGASKRLKKTSARLGRTEGGNGATNGNGTANGNGTTKRLKKVSSRLGRIPSLPKAEAPPPAPATESERKGKVTLKYHSSSSSQRLPQQPAQQGGPAAVYFGLAGPESGLYLRGRALLRDGRAVIELPDHFAAAVEPSSLTVHLTPAGECQGIYTAKRSANRVLVLEFNEGKSDAPFDWLLMGQRRGT